MLPQAPSTNQHLPDVTSQSTPSSSHTNLPLGLAHFKPFSSSLCLSTDRLLNLPKMFRTAVLRSAASVAARRSATRSFSSVVSRPALVSKSAVAPFVSRVASWNAVRGYASGSGLSKEDVEGRIMSLLAGFDKVRSLCWVVSSLLFSPVPWDILAMGGEGQ